VIDRRALTCGGGGNVAFVLDTVVGFPGDYRSMLKPGAHVAAIVTPWARNCESTFHNGRTIGARDEDNDAQSDRRAAADAELQVEITGTFGTDQAPEPSMPTQQARCRATHHAVRRMRETQFTRRCALLLRS